MKSRLVARAALVGALVWPLALGAQQIRPPKTWDEAALADWATPIAVLGVRPTHLSEADYYALRVENLRTYPVYYPGREPDGYWEMLQRVGPKPLIEPELLKSAADWVEAGRRVFDEADHLHLRTLDPKFTAAARSRDTYEKFGAQPLPDGTVFGSRWVPTGDGVALSFGNCNNCHVAYLPDGTRVPGAPSFANTSRSKDAKYRNPLVNVVQFANRYVTGAAPIQMPAGDPLGTWLYGSYGVPWGDPGVNNRLASMTKADYDLLLRANVLTGAVPRWNGSLFYPAKIPDLIGIKDRKYIDHTATHLHRGPGDLMRYAALVSYAETVDFGAHHMLENGARRVQARLPDEALYALAMYLYSLDPPKNPNVLDEPAQAGRKIFEREGCAGCHTPPLYTNNKLTLARGFVPKQPPSTLDILPLSVGTDPGLALQTRKGTGYYKVPSLKGVWYRGHYLHEGAATSLEEMFNPRRTSADYVPDGWLPPGEKARPIQGHEFGLKLPAIEREQLIAFLKTL
jgi:hypothetical protein